MTQTRPIATILRGEARFLSIAGMLLLAVALPFTLTLAALAFADGVSPMLPLAAGAPPIMIGYLACHFATRRMVQASGLERAGSRTQELLAESAY